MELEPSLSPPAPADGADTSQHPEPALAGDARGSPPRNPKGPKPRRGRTPRERSASSGGDA
jgi:hypothetical protein